MTFLIEYEAAIGSLATALMAAFLVMHFRYVMGIRDAAYKNTLPFMWIVSAAITVIETLAVAPVDAVQEEWTAVVASLFCAAVYGYQAYRYYRIWKDSDDDTWKKRRRRIAEKIELIAGRLVPVPVN